MTSNLPYQDKPDAWSSHAILSGWVLAMPPGSHILDIGTASGTLARMCAQVPLHWRGLEPVAAWAELARPNYDQFFTGRIEDAQDDFLSGADLVILGDILEHLPNPGIVLTRLVNLQKPGTSFAISVPNIANLYIRLNLLVGRFDYAERGILDRTHLRFFTLKSFKQMIIDCGLENLQIRSTPLPLNLVNPFFARNKVGIFLHGVLARITSAWPTLLGYQMLILARKPFIEETIHET